MLTSSRNSSARSERHRCCARVDVDDVAPFAHCHTDSTTLTDRERRDAAVGTEHRAAGVDDVTGAHRRSFLEKLDAAALLHEADVHALGLVRGAEPEVGRVRSHIGLGELADREHRTGQLSLTEHVEHVRLVFGAIGAAGKRILLPALENARDDPWPGDRTRARARGRAGART